MKVNCLNTSEIPFLEFFITYFFFKKKHYIMGSLTGAVAF